MAIIDPEIQSIADQTDILIPLYIDIPQRITNLQFVVKFLKSFGFKNIHIRQFVNAKDIDNEGVISKLFENLQVTHTVGIMDDDNFNKCRCVNELSESTSNPYLVMWDVDVIFTKKSLVQSLKYLRDGHDMVYPYDGHFYGVPREKFSELEQGRIDLNDCELGNTESVGGAVFFNRKSFIEGGRFNPNFKNVGFDDNELFLRFLKLGYSIVRADGPLLHLNHDRSETSVEHSKFMTHNMNLYNRVHMMSKDELLAEIKSWK